MEFEDMSTKTSSSPEAKALARKVLKAWKQARLDDSAKKPKRKIPQKSVFQMGNLTGGGLPYPGPRCGSSVIYTEPEDSPEHDEFNHAAGNE